MFHDLDSLRQKNFTFHLWPREVLFRKGVEADSFYLVISVCHHWNIETRDPNDE